MAPCRSDEAMAKASVAVNGRQSASNGCPAKASARKRERETNKYILYIDKCICNPTSQEMVSCWVMYALLRWWWRYRGGRYSCIFAYALQSLETLLAVAMAQPAFQNIRFQFISILHNNGPTLHVQLSAIQRASVWEKKKETEMVRYFRVMKCAFVSVCSRAILIALTESTDATAKKTRTSKSFSISAVCLSIFHVFCFCSFCYCAGAIVLILILRCGIIVFFWRTMFHVHMIGNVIGQHYI